MHRICIQVFIIINPVSAPDIQPVTASSTFALTSKARARHSNCFWPVDSRFPPSPTYPSNPPSCVTRCRSWHFSSALMSKSSLWCPAGSRFSRSDPLNTSGSWGMIQIFFLCQEDNRLIDLKINSIFVNMMDQPQVLQVKVFRIDRIDRHYALKIIHHSKHNLEQTTFSRTCPPNYSNLLSGSCFKVYVF